ncbi:unnamed protein product [Tilletia caries]|nr:unnamed protein product [Tilletia caries]CAD7067190.1 unnamed protein product [Tilletia caries]
MADASAAAAAAASAVKGSPNDFLKGILSCLDGYMNIALEDTREYYNGVERNSFGDAFIRGNNVLYITAVQA